MNAIVEFCIDKATVAEIVAHLFRCDIYFVPRLSSRLEVVGYAQKIHNNAKRFEAWIADTMIGLVAVYCNDNKRSIAHITSVSVVKEWHGKGIALQLTKLCIAHVRGLDFERISLEVHIENSAAIRLYEKLGFIRNGPQGSEMIMCLNSGGEL